MRRLLAGSALLLLSIGASAQSGDWPRLQSTNAGTVLVIETGANPYSPPSYSRCRLLRVDASTLTCTDLDRKTRFTFPAGEIDAVYQVKRHVFPTVVGSVLAGCFIGGLISGNPPALVIGIMGGLIWGFVEMERATRQAIDVWNGAPPNPLPPSERHVLLYTR